MTTRAYILMETEVDRLSQVANDVRRLSGVERVDTVTGPYDVIAVVAVPDLNAVGDLITNQIHKVDGIVRTVTCLSVGSA